MVEESLLGHPIIFKGPIYTRGWRETLSEFHVKCPGTQPEDADQGLKLDLFIPCVMHRLLVHNHPDYMKA